VLERPVAAYVAEFIGTFLLVLAIAMVLAVNSPSGLGYQDFAVIGLVHAFTLMMLIQTLGGTSGGHFNPAVTAALAAAHARRTRRSCSTSRPTPSMPASTAPLPAALTAPTAWR
jgi:glycerol uptake facilitator-like aquaporin